MSRGVPKDREIILADLSRCDGHYGRVVVPRKGRTKAWVVLHMWSNGEHEGSDDYPTLKEAEDSFRHEGPCLSNERSCRFTRTVAAKSPAASNWASLAKAHDRDGREIHKTCEFCGRNAPDVSLCDPKDGRDICGTGNGCMAYLTLRGNPKEGT